MKVRTFSLHPASEADLITIRAAFGTHVNGLRHAIEFANSNPEAFKDALQTVKERGRGRTMRGFPLRDSEVERLKALAATHNASASMVVEALLHLAAQVAERRFSSTLA